MSRYRVSKHVTNPRNGYHCAVGLPKNSFRELDGSTIIHGWVIPEQFKVDSVVIFVCGDTRREHALVSQFEDSPELVEKYPEFRVAGKSRFSIDLGGIPELASGRDFALELIFVSAGRSHVFITITCVRDDSQSSSLFIVGSPRSGTTVVGNSLKKALSVSADISECHLLPFTAHLKKGLDEYYRSSGAYENQGMLLHHVNPLLLNEQMLSVVKQRYLDFYKTDWIIDKTPGGQMISAIPSILRLWPDAHVIFMKRRGFENIVSRLKKFPEVDFDSHCHQWNNCMRIWLKIRDRVDNHIEVDQFDVLNEPAEVASQLTKFLDLDAEQESELTKNFSHNRPEMSQNKYSGKSSVDNCALGINSIGWSAQQIQTFRDKCGETLNNFGYSETEGYYLKSKMPEILPELLPEILPESLPESSSN